MRLRRCLSRVDNILGDLDFIYSYFNIVARTSSNLKRLLSKLDNNNLNYR